MTGKAPPFGDAGKTSATARATQAHEAAFRGRLGSTGIYKAPAGTGSSKAMPPSSSKSDSVLKGGGNSGPRSFKPIKT
jgi:hypothetical protein